MAGHLHVAGPMSLPRQVVPGRFYMVTRRCTQRMFLLRPDAATNNAFLYCLAEAAQRFRIEVILPVALSNHHHTVIYDRFGTVIEFVEHLHKFVAKTQNILRGRWENFWSTEPPCLLHLVDAEDVLAKLIYAATNPVKDHLVERVHQWPGVHGLSSLLNDRPMAARRPRHFFRSNGPMPENITLRLVIPPELGDAEQLRRTLRECVAAVEQRHFVERQRTGKRIIGRRGVLRQSWNAAPSTHTSHGNLRPTFAARSVWARMEALLRNRDFLVAYRSAWIRWRFGLQAIFPIGTYWLRRFAGVPIASSQ